MTDLQAIRRIALVMFGGAILALLAAIAGPDAEPQDHGALLVVAALDAVAFLATWAVRRPTRRMLFAGNLWGVGTVCLCVAVAKPLNAVPLYTIWSALIAAYGLSRREFAVSLAVAAAGLAVAIAGWVEPGMRTALWVNTLLTVGFAACVVRYLRDGMDDVVGGLRDVAGRLHELARRDPLTGLPNRRAFDEALGREVGRAARTGRPLSLVLFDLDHFKDVNDRHGHAIGDDVLRRFAAVAEQALRPGDALGRVGGEEFALTLFAADAEQAAVLAEQVAGRLRAATAGTAAPVTVSAGVAELCGDAPSGECLMRAADRALYAAKAGGRRRVAIAGEPARVRGEVAAIAAPAAAPAAPHPVSGPTPATAVEEPVDVLSLARWQRSDLGLLRRVAIVQSLVAALAMAVTSALAGAPVGGLPATAAVCLVLLLMAGAAAATPRLPGWTWRAMPFLGVALTSAAVAVNTTASGAGYFYLWPAVFMAYFFARRELVVLLVVLSVSYAGVLAAWAPGPMRSSDWLTTIVPVCVAALTVSTLRARMRGLLEELQQQLDALRDAASRDPLTGLLNRRAFDALLARELERARAAELPLAVAFFDLDHFKDVNDRHGHAAGDAALRTLAEVLLDDRRGGDLVARLGGEEFAVALIGAGAEEAAAVAGRAGRALLERSTAAGTALTVSAGVAAAGGRLDSPGALLRAADEALYAAKSAGRRRAAVWGEPITVLAPVAPDPAEVA